MNKVYFFILLNVLCIGAYAQFPDLKGRFNGSFESYTQFYQQDRNINAIVPQDRIGSNNYLKLDYSYGAFSAGVQFESYLPSIAGFPFAVNQSKLINRYFKYAPEKISIEIGDIYEQFGSGLVFRTWENRQIGINNALEGVKIGATPFRFLNLKALYGRQRKVFEHAGSVVRGINGEIDFSKINPDYSGNIQLSTGFSYVSRYQQYTGPDPEFNATVKAVSGRLDIIGPSASLGLEYVQKGSDPSNINNLDKTTGKVFLVNGTYTRNNLGLNLTLRSMENMDFRGERDEIGASLPVNFIPALTRQHDYLTTTIYVYAAQPFGETGGQLDAFYTIDGNNRKPSRIAFNFSHYRGLKDGDNIFTVGEQSYYRDASIEWKKKWTGKWNTTLSYHNLFYNKSVIEGGVYPDINANIVVLNALYKYTKKNSLRFELQNLFTKQDNGNWFAAVTEFGFAPAYNVYVSNLFNYGLTNIHYPSLGGSYAKSGSRFSLNYGRQRAGLFCVGGICRFVPASTGLTATLTATFNK